MVFEGNRKTVKFPIDPIVTFEHFGTEPHGSKPDESISRVKIPFGVLSTALLLKLNIIHGHGRYLRHNDHSEILFFRIVFTPFTRVHWLFTISQIGHRQIY